MLPSGAFLCLHFQMEVLFLSNDIMFSLRTAQTVVILFPLKIRFKNCSFYPTMKEKYGVTASKHLEAPRL